MSVIPQLSFPADLYYHIEHQVWLRLLPQNQAVVGITALGIALSGDIYMCRPRRTGTRVAQGGSIAVVELAKSIVSVKAPAGGEIVQINAALEEKPQLVHQDPYGDGWLAHIQLDNWAADSSRLLHDPQAVATAMQHHAWLHRHDIISP